MIIATVWPLSRLPEALAMLRAVRPQGVMLHSDAGTLRNAGPSAAASVRAALPGVEVSLGVAFDSGNSLSASLPPGSVALRTHLRALELSRLSVIETARACAAPRVCIDPEVKWKRTARGYLPGFSPEDARRVSSALRSGLRAEGRTLEATSYDCPGLHGAFPWEAWDVDAWRPQVYAFPAQGPAVPGLGASRLALHRRHWHLPGPLEVYAAAYKVTQVDSGIILDAAPTAALWALPSRVDPTGLRVGWAFARLHDSGYRGIGRLRAFQRDKGLTPDGKLGPRSFAAIEAEHGPCPVPTV